MRILIVGNGGREHTLAWKLLRDAPEATLFVTQPNGGMTSRVEPVAIAPGDVEALAGWAAAQSIDLVVVGPEAPLATGLVDRLERSGIPAFGPTKAAARIESSKTFAKALMQRAGVPYSGLRILRRPRRGLRLRAGTRRAHRRESFRAGRREGCRRV